MERFPHRLNQPPDVRQDFLAPDSYLFLAEQLAAFDPATGRGSLDWARYRRKTRVAFSHMTLPLEPCEAWEFPAVFPEPKSLPFQVDFVSTRCVRLRWRSRPGAFADDKLSPMLAGPVPVSKDWNLSADESGWTWASHHASLRLTRRPWSLELKDAQGRVLLRTHGVQDGKCMISGRPQPFGFVRRSEDLQQGLAASFKLHPGEKLFGCGESFTRLDKRGQTVDLWAQDAHGAQTGEMYKPVPFYFSDRGYGLFVHGSTPMRFDLGESYDEAQVIYNGDESLDLFVFAGGPKDVLGEYTALTGRSPLPPLWSFGLWMSRITYESEAQTREVAAKLTEHRIPCDVIHLDTGWFEHDWCCDFQFSPSRFGDAEKMIADLRRDGRHICLWQLPYFTPKNPLYRDLLDQGLAVKSRFGDAPTEELVLDFSNPATVAWYQDRLRGLLELGVDAIKVDFGEGAPLNGRYHSGRDGWHEHNLYPLRYNQAAADISRQVKGYPLIWARSAWAGSQRYPLHWGGDAEASDGGMLGSLRGGLSLGLSGFSFWSHDVGGFFPATPRELYLRWLPFGLLSSHSRCHGLPPTEPWHFDDGFMDIFRRSVELRYRLMPYLWAQAADSAGQGLPLLRPLFLEHPEDPGVWAVEDEYLLGQDVLVAPFFEAAAERRVYLPSGEWVDLQSGQRLGAGWHRLKPGPVPIVVLGRAGCLIPTLAPALNTAAQDWSRVELWALGPGPCQGRFCAPDSSEAETLSLGMGSGPPPPLRGSSFSLKRLG
jgi:alpha-D-xyloside xylohydrolase